MSEKTNVYALFIGINSYPESPLYACVDDANKMYNYIKSRKDLDIKEANLKLLTEKEATKTNIVATIKNHLGQAQADDVALLYFSGHGAQEKSR